MAMILRKSYPSMISHDSGFIPRTTSRRQRSPRQVGRTHAPWRVMNPNPDREGWMVRTPPAPSVPRRRTGLSRGATISTLDGFRTPPGTVAGGREWPRAHVYGCPACSTFHAFLRLQQVRLRPDGSFEDSGVRTVTGFALPEGTLPRITTARWQWLPLRGKPAPPAM